MVFTAVKMWIVVFWVVSPSSLVSGYQLFVRIEDGGCKSRYPLTSPHGVTTQKITFDIFTAVRTSSRRQVVLFVRRRLWPI
jgi:hypothetical protein